MKLADLRALVAEMRALGVLELEGIKLGPEPTPKLPPSKRKTMQEREDEENEAKDKKLALLLGGKPSAELAAKLRRVI